MKIKNETCRILCHTVEKNLRWFRFKLKRLFDYLLERFLTRLFSIFTVVHTPFLVISTSFPEKPTGGQIKHFVFIIIV